MKTSAVVTVLALALSLTSIFAKPGWSDDYDKSLAKAKEDKKLVLLDFTGSDWCPWCIRLDKEIFSTSEFKDYAKENLVLVELDFPQGKTLPRSVTKQNEKLRDEYKIEGYPTVIVLDSEGKKVGQLGYMEGGPAPFIEALNKLKK
jgi:thioredoxin-related protein